MKLPRRRRPFAERNGKRQQLALAEQERTSRSGFGVLLSKEPCQLGIGTPKIRNDRFPVLLFLLANKGFGPQIRHHPLDAAAWDDGEAGVAFADDGLVDGADGGAGSDVQRGAGEDRQDFRGHGEEPFGFVIYDFRFVISDFRFEPRSRRRDRSLFSPKQRERQRGELSVAAKLAGSLIRWSRKIVDRSRRHGPLRRLVASLLVGVLPERPAADGDGFRNQRGDQPRIERVQCADASTMGFPGFALAAGRGRAFQENGAGFGIDPVGKPAAGMAVDLSSLIAGDGWEYRRCEQRPLDEIPTLGILGEAFSPTGRKTGVATLDGCVLNRAGSLWPPTTRWRSERKSASSRSPACLFVRLGKQAELPAVFQAGYSAVVEFGHPGFRVPGSIADADAGFTGGQVFIGDCMRICRALSYLRVDVRMIRLRLSMRRACCLGGRREGDERMG